MLTAGVAVDKATLDFDRIFSYTVPDIFADEIKTGSIVLVPFGRGDKLRIGIVLSVEDREDVSKLKSVVDVKNEDHTVTPYALSLIKHLKETTFCTWYEAVKTVIPYGALYKIEGQFLSKQMVRHLKTVYTANTDFASAGLKTAKQKAVYEYLSTGWITVSKSNINISLPLSIYRN